MQYMFEWEIVNECQKLKIKPRTCILQYIQYFYSINQRSLYIKHYYIKAVT